MSAHKQRGDSNQLILVCESIKSHAMTEFINLWREKNRGFKELTPQEVIKIRPSVQTGMRSVFIMDELEGEAYDYILNVLQSRIICPVACLMATRNALKLHSIGGKVLASVSMHNVTACCTDVAFETRNEVRKLVELMGGKYSGDLNTSTTHLICSSVGTKKYIVATQMNIPILTPQWVTTAFELRKRQKLATDEAFMKEFKVPIFAGCVICVSGLPMADRKLVEQAVVSNGGKYSADLKSDYVTHLIATEAASNQQKLIYARKWKLPVLTQRWLPDCLEKGYFCDPNLYKFNMDLVPKETADVSFDTSRGVLSRSNSFITSQLPSSFEANDVLNFCKAHIIGLDSTESAAIEEIMQKCGATVYKTYQHGVTHVICDKLPSSEFLSKTASDDIHFVTPKWIINCCTSQRLVPIDEFELKRPIEDNLESPFPRKKSVGPMSTLSQNAINNSRNVAKRQSSCFGGTGQQIYDEISRSYLDIENLFDLKSVLNTVNAFLHNSLSDAIRIKLSGLLSELGASISINLNEMCTHCFVEDSTIAEDHQDVEKTDQLNIKLVSIDWAQECKEKRSLIGEESFRPKLLPAAPKPQPTIRATTRTTRSKNLKTLNLEPMPIPPEEDASFPIVENNIGRNSQNTSLSSTPSKLSFDLRGSLAKLKEGSTPNSLQKVASASSSNHGKSKLAEDPGSNARNDMKSEGLSAKLSTNLLSKFQKPVDHYIECSQSVQIGWEAESNSFGNNLMDNIENMDQNAKSERSCLTPKSLQKVRVFQITSIERDQRPYLENMIENLGAKVIADSSSFDPTATHLLCKAPLKSEKYMASVAKGLWVLSCSYLEESTKAGRFLNEEDFEWGSEKLGFASIQTKVHNVARAAKRWRVLVGQNGIYSGGAYSSWRVLFHTSKAKTKGLAAILNAGGAEILHEQPPFVNITGATHAFIEPNRVDMSLVSCEQLTANGVECFKNEYIADYLILEELDKTAYLVKDAPEVSEPTAKRIKVF